MRNRVVVALGAALLVAVFAVPAAATDSNHPLDCDDFPTVVSSGIKLYEGDGSSGDGAVMCTLDLLGKDGHVGNRNGAETGYDTWSGENTNHNGYWDFNNQAESMKFVAERHSSVARYYRICIYDGQQGATLLDAFGPYTVSAGSGYATTTFEIAAGDDNKLTSIAWGGDSSAAPGCADIKDAAGW